MTVKITVKGLVQGVYYRASAKKKAEELGVKGVVRNLPNDDVELIAVGDRESIGLLIEWCRVGPPSARVEDVIVEEMEEKEFGDFRIVRG